MADAVVKSAEIRLLQSLSTLADLDRAAQEKR